MKDRRAALTSGAAVRQPYWVSWPALTTWPIMFKESTFKDETDYTRTVKRTVVLIKSGKVEPQEPDNN